MLLDRQGAIGELRGQIAFLEATLEKKAVYLHEREKDHKLSQQRYKELVLLSLEKGKDQRLPPAQVTALLRKLRDDPDVRDMRALLAKPKAPR